MEIEPILENASITSTFHKTSESASAVTSSTAIQKEMNSIKKRHVLAIYAFCGFFIAYALRANLSVAIVDMAKTESAQDVHSTPPTSTAAPNLTTSAPASTNSSLAPTVMMTTVHYGDKKWSPILQGYILSSFFFGYIVTQLPAAFLTTKYGGRLFFGVGIGFCALLSLFMPLATYIGPSCVIVLRVAQGLAQGFAFPAMHCLWSKWAPPFERSRLATFALSGSYIGSVFALSVGGVIGKTFNWQAIFYVFGVAGIIWAILWYRCIYESPFEHRSISEAEKELIESSLAGCTNTNKVIPWRAILSSQAVWAIVCAHFAENWGFYTMLTEMPTFLAEIMNYKIDKAGILSAFPYLMMAVVLYTSGNVSDRLILRKMSYTNVRKIFCCTGLLAQAFFMYLMVLSDSPMILITMVTFAIGLGGMAWASFGVNHLDIGAQYANVLMSISNTFASIPGILSPMLTGHLIENNTKSEWNVVFCISATIYVIGGIVFALIGTGELQPWAYISEDQNELQRSGISNMGANFYDDRTAIADKTSDDDQVQYGSRKNLISSSESKKAPSTRYDTLSSTVVLNTTSPGGK